VAYPFHPSHPMYSPVEAAAARREDMVQRLELHAAELGRRALLGRAPYNTPTGHPQSAAGLDRLIAETAAAAHDLGVDERLAAVFARLALHVAIGMEQHRAERIAADVEATAAAARRHAEIAASQEQNRLAHRAELDARELAARRAGREARERGETNLDAILSRETRRGARHENFATYVRLGFEQADERIAASSSAR
jgi:hypothetical protein